MADQIVITEKTSQAKDIRAAVGSRYGDILPAEGHLFDLLEPEDVVPAWKRWSPILLRPEGLYGTRPVEGRNKAVKLKAIREALRSAKRVWLATDCDREGQLIGQEILDHYEYRGQIMRVLFTAQDSQTIRDAFARAKPNSEYASLYAAAVARRQADQIYNLSLTRTATVILGRGARGVIGVGRVKTPTLAIVCKRELEIRNFVPLAYFEVVATANVAGGQFRMRHAPQERIVRRELAQEVVNAARGFEGPLGVRVEEKGQGPPKLHDLPSLQKFCSSRFGWPAAKTLEVAQELYDGQGKKIITYPRAEVRYLPESLIKDVPRIVAGLRVGKSFSAIPVPEPLVIRKGARGSFYDKGLEGASHHAVIPNVDTVDELREVWPRLSIDEKKLFDVIARAYLAAIMPDFRYRQTNATLDVRGFAFRAAGRQPIELGWRAAFPDWQPADEKGEDAQLLPALRNGEITQLENPTIEDKETRPPPRYNEGTLIDAMQNAWRFVDNEVLRERLKEARGIGTPATRAEIIGGLKKQGFLIAQGKNIVPSTHGENYEDRRTLSLRRDHLRGGGRSRCAPHLPLHRLPDALWVGFSHEHPGIRRAFCASGRTEDLYQDRRKRQQTPPRLLRHLRHPDLCLRSGQSADLRLARRYDHPARRLRPAAADLAAVCTALGGCARPRPGGREGLNSSLPGIGEQRWKNLRSELRLLPMSLPSKKL